MGQWVIGDTSLYYKQELSFVLSCTQFGQFQLNVFFEDGC